MNPFDIIVIIILAYSLIRGVFRGVVREISSIIGVLGGFYAAYTYYPRFAQLIAPWVSDPGYRNILSFMVIFSAVVIVVAILAVVIKYLLNIAYLGWIDRFSGAVFGLVKGALVCCVIFIVLTAFLPKGVPLIQNSTLAPYGVKASEIMAGALSQDMKNKFLVKIKEFQKYWTHP
jgi:membrane protein required for colicin V production